MIRPELRRTVEYTIRSGGYTATVSARAGALRKLAYEGRDLVVPFSEGGPIPDYRGIIAAPWPNRIADGHYTFDGAAFSVPVNETERGCALHGFAFAFDWDLVASTEDSVTLAVEIPGGDGYPSSLRLESTYSLAQNRGASDGEDGLSWSVRAVNTGEATAPYGVCPHPYLVAGESPLDSWELELPAEQFLEVTPDRLLPLAERAVEGHEFDFRRPRRIGGTEIDHAFTGIAFDAQGTARMAVRDLERGTGVGMAWDRTCPWLQVHTADKKPPLPNRLGLAVEPMTCPPDAFNSGKDLIRLEPGAEHMAEWRIYAL
ncbi:aldose 1-epimerase family protein [Sinomonas susongensis]|uniref:aldose 1-epimerase family protein n=1 Tax=Sinomonas susongensis TaxID=1324851 RepID=UPI0011090E2A|nr:aldose 1-epimerase family protein [Sinomonas susongensis]